MEHPSPAASPQIVINPPRTFTGLTVCIICGYGVLLMIPVIVSLLVVSVMQLGPHTVLIPLLTFGVVTLFLPFGFGNPYIARLVRALPGAPARDPGSVIVQLTLTPRIRSGLRGLFDDADDVGWLTITDSALIFDGDSVNLCIPHGQIQRVRSESIGLRGLFLYRRVTLAVSGLGNVTSLAFAERSSCLLPSSRKRATELYARIAAKSAPG